MPSVQQTLERALTTLLREKIEVTGAGRTDTGVNASYYVAHFDCAAPVPDPAQVGLQTEFPASGRHRRGEHDARRRRMRTRVSQPASANTVTTSSRARIPLRGTRRGSITCRWTSERMNEAAASLLEYDDFTSFAKLNSNNKTNICRVMHAVMDGRRAGRALLHDPRRPFSAQHGAVAGRDAGRCGTRALYARRRSAR